MTLPLPRAMPTEAEVEALANAMWQLLDDMAKRGLSVCLAAKAEARVAYEPFKDDENGKYADVYADWMTLEEANAILDE